MTRIADEIWLQALLRQHGARASAFEGLTTADQRKKTFRDAIERSALGETEATQQRGAAVSFRDLFRNLYGEEL